MYGQQKYIHWKMNLKKEVLNITAQLIYCRQVDFDFVCHKLLLPKKKLATISLYI